MDIALENVVWEAPVLLNLIPGRTRTTATQRSRRIGIETRVVGEIARINLGGGGCLRIIQNQQRRVEELIFDELVELEPRKGFHSFRQHGILYVKSDWVFSSDHHVVFAPAGTLRSAPLALE